MCDRAICALFLIMLNCEDAKSDTGDIKYYEYGNRTEDQQISYFFQGSIPIFSPHYCMDIKPIENESLEPKFASVKVAYFNRVSNVNIEFKPETSMLCFDIKYPFIETPIGIWGYSLPYGKKDEELITESTPEKTGQNN